MHCTDLTQLSSGGGGGCLHGGACAEREDFAKGHDVFLYQKNAHLSFGSNC